LLLFYAIECGLKAVLLRRRNLEVIDETIGRQHLHDINGLLTEVRAGREYMLPASLKLAPIRNPDGTEQTRNVGIGALNQVWRYGASLDENTNTQLEKTLDKIEVWVVKEIR
jgi:hypothetical protein